MGRKKIKPFFENVQIEALAAEGNSVAKVDGKVLFVQKGIPGDVVDVQVISVDVPKKRIALTMKIQKI